jgi:hypothetical protein
MGERCEKCGALIAIVGKAHNCRGAVVTVWRAPGVLVVTEPATKIETKIPADATKKPRGRPRLGTEPMSATQRSRRHRAAKQGHAP